MSQSFPAHPLDPLSADEIRQAVSFLRTDKQLDDRCLFEQIVLREPAKAVVREFEPGQSFERRAFLVVLDRRAEKTFEALVNLTLQTLECWEEMPGKQPWIMAEEMVEIEALVKANPEYQEGLRKRGIENLDQVVIELFAAGNFGAEEELTRRLVRPHSFFCETPGDNPHVRPIEGLVPVVDMNKLEVLRVEDFGVRPIPPDKGEYRAEKLTKREPLAPLEISQPQGAGFSVEGYGITWQNWSLRLGFSQREGLVLHRLRYMDGDQDRPVLYRASLSELVVPYAETMGDHYRNHSFDAGEAGFGNSVNALTLGCDCLGEIRYLDVVLADGHGEPRLCRNAICLHEEDYGVLWKHSNWRSGSNEVRRSRRFVISSFFTVGNYDYGLFWYLYLDGTIEFEAKLTGVLYCGALHDGEEPRFGKLVAPNVNGMIHEHYFNLRLDMEVDGQANCVVETEAQLVPTGPDNPYGNAHGVRETVLESEKSAARDLNPALGRSWKVINRGKTSALGWHPGYRLVPGSNVKPMHQPGSPFMRRAGFVAHDLWVTAYDPDQLYAPGNYVNQNIDGPGLVQWVEEDRSLVDQDLVLWTTLGVFHVPRPEDFPIMPVEYTGLMLKPVGFFDQNPAMDLAPEKPGHM